MPVRKFKGAKAKADTLYSLIIRSLGYCEAEGRDGRACSSQLQTAHICSRRYSATRTDTRNAFCLCFSHHRYYTDFPREFSKFITDTWAQEYYETIRQKSVRPTKVNWEERVEFLKRIKDGEISLAEAREMEDE